MKAAGKMGAKVLGAVLVVMGFLALSTPARAEVTVNSNVIDFGTVAVGARSASINVTLTNDSSRDARFRGAWISSSQFSYSGPSRYFSLRPHQSVSVSVSFRPDRAQAFTGVLVFRSSNNEPITVSLSGTGTATTSDGSRRARRGRWHQSDPAPTTTSTPEPTPEPAPTVAAPSITSQPVNRTVTAGQTASFSITAGGTSLAYQWKKNGAAIGGATSSSFTTAATIMSDSGAQFTCTVSNSAGSVTSSAATLTVSVAAVAPSISSQPASRTVIAGQTALFSVSVSGTAPFTYQWKKNGAAINGATSSSYTTPAATTSDSGAQFTVTVSNSVGSATSNPATLTVNAATLLLSVNQGSLSFGNIDVGSSTTQQVTLTNSGNGNVTLSGMSVAGAGFSVSGASSGQILTPGQTATISISFQPVAAGSVTGSVTVASNAASRVISLSGAGVQLVSRTVSLSWVRSTSTVNGYLVYSSQVSGGPYTRLTTSAVSLPSYSDASVQNGKTYYYVVTAVDAQGVESTYSNQASAVIQ